MSGRHRFLYGFLAIELLDELVYGVRETAWPLIRDDLFLSYGQIGLLLAVPMLLSVFFEPLLGVASDGPARRPILLAGGAAFAVALLLTGLSGGFWMLLAATILLYSASGAFVSLSQAALMDAEPERREQNMVRWGLSGSAGQVLGSLAVAAIAALGIGWRWLFLGLAPLALAALLAATRLPLAPAAAKELPADEADGEAASVGLGVRLREAVSALRRREVLRWLVLLQFADLMLDVLYGFLALYFVDVTGVSPAQAAMAALVWTLVGLPADVLLLRVLERVPGLVWLRFSAAAVLVVFSAFLLVPGFVPKLVLLGLLGLLNAGWYAIPKARLYAELPGRSGTVVALGSISAVVGSMMPLALGLLAGWIGLQATLWLLLLGPAAFVVGLPRAAGTASGPRKRSEE
jgi:MFS transporter, FSR family, fosmidomycin resistance protein